MIHIIIGGGAAGYFGAIACAESHPEDQVILLEKSRQPLAKVRISGGGRCNVTHSCFDPALLVKNYPRGNKELRGPFSRFQPKDTIAWFEQRGVDLKTEEDGRMFPTTDSSETIVQCLQREAKKMNVDVRLGCGVEAIVKENEGFTLQLSDSTTLSCTSLLIATGSAPKMFPLITALGHTLIPLVPSLFTFNVPDSPFVDLSGVSVEMAHVTIPEIGMEQSGPLLVTHWGFSGPAVLKLSAWGARALCNLGYQATLLINWLPQMSMDDIALQLKRYKEMHPAKSIGTDSPYPLPRQLWRKIVDVAGVSPDLRFSTLSKKQMQDIVRGVTASTFSINGKTTYKQEFVTCGGVALSEVNFKTMESKVCPGLYFAGEVLDIDGVTGGFNFQNAWTTSWIAGHSM